MRDTIQLRPERTIIGALVSSTQWCNENESTCVVIRILIDHYLENGYVKYITTITFEPYYPKVSS